MLHRGVFRYHCIRLYHAKERWFACFIFMQSWTTARIAAGNVTNSNHCADTRCGVVFLRGHLSGVALLQTDDVFSGRSGLFVKYRRAAVPRPGGDSNIDYRKRLRQQCRGCGRDDSSVAVAGAGPQCGLRQTRQTATTEHVCRQFYTSSPSRQQSDVSEDVTLSRLCAVVSD